MTRFSQTQRQFCRAAIRSLCAILILGGMAVPSDARSLAEIKKSGELRVCISPYHPYAATAEPAGCQSDCKWNGLVYEEALAFAATLGKKIQPKFVRVNWDEQFFNKDGQTLKEASYTPELMATGKCDLYPSKISKNEWRSKKLDFVVQYVSRMMVIVPKARKDQFKSVQDLAGKTLATERNSSHHTWAQEQNQNVLKSNPIQISLMTTPQAEQAVIDGAADFTLSDAARALWTARRQPSSLAVTFTVGTRDEIGWALRKEDKDLQDLVRIFFDHQRQTPNSAINQIWKTQLGLTLTEFITLMTAVK